MDIVNDNIISITVTKNRYAPHPPVYTANFLILDEGDIISLKELTNNIYMGDNKIIYRLVLNKEVERLPKEEYVNYLKYIL